MNDQSQIEFYPRIPKIPPPDYKGKDRLNRHYSLLELYLGSLAALTFMSPGKPVMQKFIKFLNNLSYQEIGNEFVEKIKKASKDFFTALTGSFSEKGYEVLLIPEVPFIPTQTQVEKTISFLKDPSRLDLLRQIVSGEIEEITLPSGKIIQISDLFPSTQNRRDSLEEEDRIYVEQLRRAIGYYYFHIPGTASERSERRALALATARIDGIMFFRKQSSSGDSYYTLEQLYSLFKRFLLDPTNFNDQEKNLLRQVIEDFYSGKLKFIIIEIKSHFFAQDPPDKEKYIRDISHSLLAMLEFFTTAVRICGLENDPRFSFLFGLMSIESSERLNALFQSRRVLRTFKNCLFFIININWPILIIKDSLRVLMFQNVLTTSPRITTQKFSFKEILKGMRYRARTMFEELANQHF